VSSRWFAAIASIVLVVVTLSPVLRDPGDDGFPLSTYPMFATARPRRLTMSYALGVTRTGERRTLRPRLIGSGEVLQAYMIVGKAVQGGRDAQLALCKSIAAKIRASGDEDIVTVRIVTGTHDALDVLLDDKLGRETEKVRCQVRT
jgi:hypothetical protein